MAGKLENDEDPRKTGSLELEPRYSDQTDSPGLIQLTKC